MPILSRFAGPLALLLVLSPACARDSAVAQGAQPTPSETRAVSGSAQPAPVPARPGAQAAARGVIRAFIMAAPDTLKLSPAPEAGAENRQPTADYPSLEAARDSIGALLHRWVSKAGPAVRMTEGHVRFKYWYAADSTDGWAFHIVVTDTSECPNQRLENALIDLGWVEASGYTADGPDGGTMGMASKHALCVIEAQWDGGDDSDTTYVPAPGCEMTVTCVPRREDDVMKW